MLKKILIGVGALFVLLIIIGLFASPESEETAETTTTTPRTTTTTGPATTTKKPAAKPKPRPAPKPKPAPDTGRMSDTEFQQFQRAHAELVDESLEFTEGIQTCSVIGQTGDLVGFRTCVQESYSGLDEDVEFAFFVATGTLEDVAKQCQAALRSYAKITRAYQATVALAFDVANRLDFDAFEGAYGALGPASRQYSKFSTNALAACAPR